jgi:hypothetical protein
MSVRQHAASKTTGNLQELQALPNKYCRENPMQVLRTNTLLHQAYLSRLLHFRELTPTGLTQSCASNELVFFLLYII